VQVSFLTTQLRKGYITKENSSPKKMIQNMVKNYREALCEFYCQMLGKVCVKKSKA
jgi:hypothetical protein